MPNLITDFVKVAQSGPCIDGRSIDAAWLTDMADTYDPAVYAACIWPDHIRWGNNYGKVVALESRVEEGVTSLYARLAPNAQYIWGNQFDQLLHFSIEVAENFAGTGKAYLAGLGITDSPASLGTDALKFSMRSAGHDSQFFSNVPAVNLRPEAEQTPSWFTKFLATFNKTEDESMTPEQVAAFNQRLDGMEATLQALQGSLHASAGTDTIAKAEAQTQGTEAQSQFATEFTAALTPVLESVQKLSTQVDSMAKRFEAAQPQTISPTSTGPAGDAAPLL